MEDNIREYCSTIDNGEQINKPQHAKHRLLHLLDYLMTLWTPISIKFIMDLPYSNGYVIILVVVDPFTKMANLIPLGTQDSLPLAKAYLQEV